MANLLDCLWLAFSDYFMTLFHIHKLGHVLFDDMVKTASNSVRTAGGGVGDCQFT